MKISYYKSLFSSSPDKQITVYKAMDMIRLGECESLVKDVRFNFNNPEKKKALKERLPLFGFGGTFTTRSNKTLVKHSSLACLDFDHLPNVEQAKRQIAEDPYTFCVFVSPSGDGLKVLVRIPLVDNDKDYKSFYVELRNHFNQYGETDSATSDISRATFISYDPDLICNVDSEMFTDRFIVVEPVTIRHNVALEDYDEVAKRLIVWFKKKWTTGANRNSNLFILSSAFNDYGVPKDTALNYCLGYSSKDFGSAEINNLVDSAYKNSGNFGMKTFEDTSKSRALARMVSNGQTQESIGKKIELTEGVIKEIKKLKATDDNDCFWSLDDKGKIEISAIKFDFYLRNRGISKYYPYDGVSEFEFIQKNENFIDWIDPSRIKDIVKKDLINRCESDVWSKLAMMTNFFKKDMLSMLDTVEVQPKRDEKNAAYLYYRNFAVKTTDEGSELIEYSDVEDVVWKNQVIDRDIALNSESHGEFKTFIWRVSGEDADRYYTLKSVIGYLLHSYQNDSKPKAIIFNDEMISEDVPNGGSGKGLIHKAIGQIKNIVVEDGKKFDPNHQFAYQKVSKDTQIFLLDDVSKSFDFEKLFSIVTEGMTVEKKGKDAYQIPFKESPKISITTNYTIKGEGASHNRRVFEVEIANHYNDSHTPEDEFNHQFFTEWDADEFGMFDNFMIRCIQFYLKNGLVESNKVNLAFRKMKNNLGAEFIEFMESIDMTERVSKKALRDRFNSEYQSLARWNTAQKFNKKIKEYCIFNGYEVLESQSNGVPHLEFSKGNEPTNTETDAPF